MKFMLQCQSSLAAADRYQMAIKAGQAGLSAAARSYLAVSAQQLQFGTPEQELLDVVQDFFENGGDRNVCHATDVRYHRGVEWQCEVRVSATGADAASVWVGAVPSLVIAGTRIDMEDDIVKGPCSYSICYTVGSTVARYNDQMKRAGSVWDGHPGGATMGDRSCLNQARR
jgi:hypothetical protein